MEDGGNRHLLENANVQDQDPHRHHHRRRGRLPVSGRPAGLGVRRELPSGTTTTHAPGARPALRAGSAGIPGYDDATCEGLANDYNTAIAYANDALNNGEIGRYAYYRNLAQRIYGQVSDNCIVLEP